MDPSGLDPRLPHRLPRSACGTAARRVAGVGRRPAVLLMDGFRGVRPDHPLQPADDSPSADRAGQDYRLRHPRLRRGCELGDKIAVLGDGRHPHTTPLRDPGHRPTTPCPGSSGRSRSSPDLAAGADVPLTRRRVAVDTVTRRRSGREAAAPTVYALVLDERPRPAARVTARAGRPTSCWRRQAVALVDHPVDAALRAEAILRGGHAVSPAPLGSGRDDRHQPVTT